MYLRTIAGTACVTLAAFLLAAGCKKEVDINAQRDKVRFWNNELIVADTIDVTLYGGGGSSFAQITQSKALTNCEDDPTGTARFTTKARDYTYHAVSRDGWIWDGKIRTEPGCNLYELNSADATSVPMVPITFYTTAPVGGRITVMMDNGYGGYITRSQSSTVCGRDGDANFHQEPGTHTYRATSDSGRVWTGSVLVSDRHCNLVELR